VNNLSQQSVSKAWNFGHVLRDDGVSYMGYTEQITLLLFVQIALGQIDTAIDHDLARAVRLRQAILKREFSGQLVPQDAADEPAAAFLGRIEGTNRISDGGHERADCNRDGPPPFAAAHG
jgi:hypothetical protein